ncbi:hypothetical protein DFJ73DRAFT_945374 [Zopfochytrium polystomum]|nr:hypothetical protein DFJ73DRAFT_945374 [Zopfochytrium polystomum]
MVAVRSYIDLSYAFDLHHDASEEDHDVTILQSIPLLFPINSILRGPACYLDKLSAQAINSVIEVGQSLRLRPFEMRLEFWKGLIDRADDSDGSIINSLTSSFESDQAMEALQYLETYVKTHLGTLVERCKTISIPVENGSDRESERESEGRSPSGKAWDLLNVLEFTVKTAWSRPSGVKRPICTSPDWIPFWKQIVVREMDPNNSGELPQWLWRYFYYSDKDSDKVIGLAVDTLLQTISEIEIDKSDVPVYQAFIGRQLKLFDQLFAGVHVIGEQVPKLIAILADILFEIFGPFGEFESNIDELVGCYSLLENPYSYPLDYLPICGGDDCHLKYIRSIDWNVNIVLSKLNEEEGVGKLIACLAPEMSDGMLLQLLNAILKFLPNYSVENSEDSDLHESCFPVLSTILAQRGFVDLIQPLVQFLFRNINHHWGSEVVESVVISVIRHLSFITLSDMVVVWNRIQEEESYSEAFTTAFTEQMAILINEKSASIEDMESLLLEDLEQGRRTLHPYGSVHSHARPYGSALSLWRGFRVMKAVRLLCKRVVGFRSASPRITQSLMDLLSAYSNNHACHTINHLELPPVSDVQSPELDFVVQMLDPGSRLVISHNVACCLKEVWVEAVFCEAWRFCKLRASEESPFWSGTSTGADFRRVLSTDMISIWKAVLERDETWFEQFAFGERVKKLYKKYGPCFQIKVNGLFERTTCQK